MLTFIQINQSVSVAIQDFTYKKDYFYLFNTSESECSTCYELHLLYMKPLYGRKILAFSLEFPFQTILEFNLPPVSEVATIELFDYYANDPSDEALITLVAGDEKTIGMATTSSVFVLSILGSNSISSSVRNLMILEIIYLLKFIDLNYPQNLLTYFTLSVKLETTVIYDIKFKKDSNEVNKIPKLFQLYELSPYFLENAGQPLTKFFIVWITGLFVLLLTRIFKNKKRKINKILNFIKAWLVWYYVITVFLTDYQMIIFKALCSFIYPTSLTSIGQINMAMAIIAFLLYISIGIKFIYVVNKKNKNKIIPMDCSRRTNVSIFPYSSKDSQKEVTGNSNNIIEISEEPKVTEIYESNSIQVQEKVKKPMEIHDKIALTKIHQNKLSINDKVEGTITLNQTTSTVVTSQRDTKFETIFDSSPLKCYTKSGFRTKNSQVQNIEGDDDSYLFLYQDLKEEKLLQKHFLVVDLCRQTFIAIVVCTSRLNAFSQILIVNLIQWSYLFFAFMTSPFKSGFSVLNFSICELILTSILFEFFLIGIYDIQNIKMIDDRIKIGWAIIYSNFCFKLIVLALLIGKTIFDACKDCKEKRKKKIMVSCG